MNSWQNDLLSACRRLVALNDSPEPGLATWHMACATACDDIRTALDRSPPPPVGKKGAVGGG